MPTSKWKMEDLAREGKKKSKLNFSGHKHQSAYQASVLNPQIQLQPTMTPSEESKIERILVDEPSSEQLLS